jgi:hypothetical protein
LRVKHWNLKNNVEGDPESDINKSGKTKTKKQNKQNKRQNQLPDFTKQISDENEIIVLRNLLDVLEKTYNGYGVTFEVCFLIVFVFVVYFIIIFFIFHFVCYVQLIQQQQISIQQKQTQISNQEKMAQQVRLEELEILKSSKNLVSAMLSSFLRTIKYEQNIL